MRFYDHFIGWEKGGTGKSTMATNLAAAHVINGHDVILVDADKQCRLCNLRDENGHTPRVLGVQKLGKTLHIELKELEKRYETVVGDSGGRDSVELRSAMLVGKVVSLVSDGCTETNEIFGNNFSK